MILKRFSSQGMQDTGRLENIVNGIQDKGKRIALQERLPISVSKIEKFIHANGWTKTY